MNVNLLHFVHDLADKGDSTLSKGALVTIASQTLTSAPAKAKQFYTVEQARMALVLVERVVDDILGMYSLLVDLEGEIELAECVGDERALDDGRRKLVAAIDRLQDCLEELETLGVEMCDFKRGAVEFFSIDRGREICLSWCKGEETIRYWYHRGQSIAERRDVEELEQRLFQFV
jgi:hypothetical protein